MVSDKVTNKDEELLNDRLLRREAGEGWHPDGVNTNLLGALVIREKILDEIIEQREKDEAVTVWDDFLDQVKHINDLKEKLDISDPPPSV
jgi:hypothetical protein